MSTGGDPGARATGVPAPSRIPLPAAAKYIIGTEACERFSFYGMRNILTLFLAENLLRMAPPAEREPEAKATFHLFMMGVYLFPLLGGYWPIATGANTTPSCGCRCCTSPATRCWRCSTTTQPGFTPDCSSSPSARGASSRVWRRSWATS